MATGKSGSLIWTTSGGSYEVKVNWSETYDISTNSSTVTIDSVQARSVSGYYGYAYYPDGIIQINGVTVKTMNSLIPTGKVEINAKNTWYTISNASCSLSGIEHNADGSKSINITLTKNRWSSFQFFTISNGNESGWGVSGTQSITLTTIPRASSITSADNIVLGENCNIKWTPASSNFKYKIQFSLGNWHFTTDYISPNTTSEYTYTGKTLSGTEAQNDTTIYSQMPSSTTGTMTVVLTTYNSSNAQIGSSNSKTFTVTIPDSVKPTVGTITLDPVDINGTNILVHNKNKLNVSVSGCTPGTGSTIKSYTFSGSGISYTGTNTSITSDNVIFAAAASDTTLTYTVTVTDNRDRSTSKTATITCYAYSSPYFTSFNAYRCDQNGNVSDDGEYFKCEYGLQYASVNNTNDIDITVYYQKGAANASSVSASTGSKDKSGNKIVSGIDADGTYSVYAIITDNYGGRATSTSVTVFGQSRILNISNDGTGVAIGKMSESSQLFECKWEAQFYDSVSGPKGFSTPSDRNIKKNIQDIDHDIIDSLRPVQYELIHHDDGKTHYGFIAQEVNDALLSAGINPDVTGVVDHVMHNSSQGYALIYTEFIPLLTKKCQLLQHEVNALKLEIEALKKEIQN